MSGIGRCQTCRRSCRATDDGLARPHDDEPGRACAGILGPVRAPWSPGDGPPPRAGLRSLLDGLRRDDRLTGADLSSCVLVTDADLSYLLSRPEAESEELLDAVAQAQYVRRLATATAWTAHSGDGPSPAAVRLVALDIVAALRRYGQLNGAGVGVQDQLTSADLNALEVAASQGDDRELLSAVLQARSFRASRTTGPPSTPPPAVPTVESGQGQILDAASAQALPELHEGDAVVQWLNEDTVIVMGNVSLADGIGSRLQPLSPALSKALLGNAVLALQGVSAGAQAAAAVSAMRDGAVLYKVAADSLSALQQYGSVVKDGRLLGVLRDGNKGFAHMLRFEASQSHNVLKAAASLGNLLVVAAVFAGQLKMQRTLTVLCEAVDDLKQRDREQQISEVTVASQQVLKVLGLALEVGELTEGLREELPDLALLRVHVERASMEVQRWQRRLDKLPSKAADRLPVLERTVDDVVLALGLYREAERTLSAAEALRRYALEQDGDPALDALTRHEEKARLARLSRGQKLARDLDTAMRKIEADPGSSWFRQNKRDKIRKVAQDVRQDLRSLGAPQPALPAA